MEKEDLKILNKGEEEEMVCISTFLCTLLKFGRLYYTHFSGGARLSFVSVATSTRWPWGAAHWGLPPSLAVLDARMVRQIHLHPHYSARCRSGVVAIHGT